MIQAMLSGVASIQAQQTRMNVIGNDLANINTTAFKGQDVNFEELVSQVVTGATAPSGSLGGTDGIQYGLGVQVGDTVTNMTQGSLSATGNPSDLAIQGNGFFMTSNGNAISYTRDGSFDIDSAGNLVCSDTGEKVLGWAADASGNINTQTQITDASTLTIPIGSLNAAQATSSLSMTGNLNSDAAATDTATITCTVYDSLGNAQQVTLQFSNPTTTLTAGAPSTAVSQWSWTAYSGTGTSGAVLGSSTSGTNAPIYFNSSGQEVSNSTNSFTGPALTGATPTTITMDLSNIQELGASSQLSVSNQNGYPPGSLESYTVGLNGIITGAFSNGLSRQLGQIALATFPNSGGLLSIGSNLYMPSGNSGVASVSVANAGNKGSINSGFLEQSNVDLSTSLTNLIITQRGFEANTKIITTVDTMMQDLIEMKH
jgi:flagellar hook protein FlgE